MREIVESNIPFERVELPSKEAVQLFKDEGLEDKYELLRNRTRIYTSIYKLGDTVNYYFGNLAPSTGVIHLFGLELYESGMLLKVPQPQHPTTLSHTHQVPKLFSVYCTDAAGIVGTVGNQFAGGTAYKTC